MASAFTPSFRNSTYELDYDTDDDEVKINCIRGCFSDESDSYSSSNETPSSECSDDDESSGPVKFVDDYAKKGCFISKPTAFTLSTLQEVGEDTESGPKPEQSHSKDLYCRSSASDGGDEDLSGEEMPGSSSDSVSIASGTSLDTADSKMLLDHVEVSKSEFMELISHDGSTGELGFLENDDEKLIGVEIDVETDTPMKLKRILSATALNDLDTQATSSKRAKTTAPVPPVVTLNMSFHQSLPQAITRNPVSVVSSCDDEFERRLGEELADDTASFDGTAIVSLTPVPLLTPPESPISFNVGGDTTTICEWPSNLVVDRALASASELRPMSPASFHDFMSKEGAQV